MSFEVIKKLGDDKVQAELMPKIENWYFEARELLPNLPDSIKIYFFEQDDPGIMKELGVGGYAYSSEIMSLGFALDFEDKVEQLAQLKSTIFHEALHISQGYTGSGETTQMIECLAYEGLATVFEREILGNRQPYGEYPNNEELIMEWIDSIKNINTPWDYSVYRKWAFRDPETGERWILYKGGTWLIDQILKKNKSLSVLDLTKMTAKEILMLT
jgi:uncharacterized protein YjaZ